MKSFAWMLIFALAAPASAAAIVDDSDLTQGWLQAIPTPKEVPLTLAPDQITTEPTPGSLVVQVLREDHGKLTPVIGLPLKLASSQKREKAIETDLEGQARFPSCAPGQATAVEGTLQRTRFRVAQVTQAYSIHAPIPCTGTTRLIFRSDSNGGQALGIWQIVERAERKLGEAVGLAFWTSPILMRWPADSDYYSWNTVNLTLGHQWDVVGHELGHAIYDQADLGRMGGGSHKIDECYTQELALSEGWASFFSAWVSLDLHDPDARFEYMVPRRAPIRFENIPADVCPGQFNEWRVTGFFWDLVDLHADSESAEESFARIWRAMEGKQPPSASAARDLLVKAGFDPELLQTVWLLNFQK